MLSEKMIVSDECPMPLRIKFRKVGMLQYISHLDLQRTFAKVITRSGIPAWYTKGFNPHAKLVFALPLSVGTSSETEFLDIRLREYMSYDEVKERLNSVLTDELCAIEVYEPKHKFTDIGFAEYEMEMITDGADAALAEKINALFASPSLMMLKHTKSGEKEIDIVPLIKSFSAEYSAERGSILMRARLSAVSTDYLGPDMLITAMKDRLGVLSGDIMRERYSILRTGVYLLDGETLFR